MAKQLSAPYRPGRRSPTWLKIKPGRQGRAPGAAGAAMAESTTAEAAGGETKSDRRVASASSATAAVQLGPGPANVPPTERVPPKGRRAVDAAPDGPGRRGLFLSRRTVRPPCPSHSPAAASLRLAGRKHHPCSKGLSTGLRLVGNPGGRAAYREVAPVAGLILGMAGALCRGLGSAVASPGVGIAALIVLVLRRTRRVR